MKLFRQDKVARGGELVGNFTGNRIVRLVKNPESDLLNLVADGKAEEEQLNERHPEKNGRRSAVTKNVVKLLEHKAPETVHSLHEHHYKKFNELKGIVANNISITLALIENVGWRVISTTIEARHYPVIYIRNAPARGNSLNVCIMV